MSFNKMCHLAFAAAYHPVLVNIKGWQSEEPVGKAEGNRIKE
jgi:hypothetical protein